MPTFPTIQSGSMLAYGSLLNEALVAYPLGTGHNYVTRVHTFLGDHEQRYVVRREFLTVVVEYSNLSGYDASLLRTFYFNQIGAYVTPSLSNTFSLTLFGVTYNYCAFVEDSLEETQSRDERFSMRLSIAQIRPN